MCMGCWADDGYPWDKSRAAVAMASRLADAQHFCAMHIVVEDSNLDDDSIKYCRDLPEATGEERAMCSDLLMMTMGERWTAHLLSEDPDFDHVAWRAKLTG
jgi:hypothetical protein